MRNVVFLAVLVLMMCGCEDDDMALKSIPISWPLTGGLDTKRSPLSVQPGSHLTLDNVVQERLNEWRRRNGFTQSATDTMPETSPYFVGALGASGMFENGQGGLSAYSPSLTSNRWGTAAISAPPQERSRLPLVDVPSKTGGEVAVGCLGMAISGNLVLVGRGNGTTSATLTLIDTASGASKDIAVDQTIFTFKGAATDTKLVMFGATLATGNLIAYVVDIATGAVTAGATIKAGVHAGPFLDAVWYGGSTITVVTRLTTNAIRFMEFNPSTGALATDVSLAGVSSDSALALLQDPDASGVRFVGSSFGGLTTRVTRVSSAGAVLTNDQVEAYDSCQITGVAWNAGANFTVIYQQTGSGDIRIGGKEAGAMATPRSFQTITWDGSATIDSAAWRDPLVGDATGVGVGWSVIVGLHSLVPDDPQDSWVEFAMPLSIASATAAIPVASISSLAAGNHTGASGSLFQVTRTASRQFAAVLPVQVIYEDNAGTIVRHYSADLFRQTYLKGSDIATASTQKPAQFKQTSYVPGAALSFYDQGVLRRLGTPTPPRILTGVASNGAGLLTSSAEYGYVAIEEAIDSDGNIWRSPPSVPLLITLGATDDTVTLTYKSWRTDLYTVRVGIYRTAANGSSYRRIYSFLAAPGADVVYTDLFADSVATDGEIRYTEGELATIVTPPALAVWFFDDRMWIINAEYRTETWYTKNLRPGRQPEFTGEMVVDQDDEFGDATNGAALVDKGVLFKKNAIYFSVGDGFTDSGSGTNYRWVKISDDVGAIPGSPVISAGNVLYFVSERGIHTVDQMGKIVWMDAADAFLNQPLINTPATVYDGCFVPLKNEVRLVTDQFLLVHDLTFNTWKRYTGLTGFRRCLVIDGNMVLFKTDGTVWREGTETQLTDAGTAFTGIIRSPWMRPAAGAQGPGTASTGTTSRQAMRLYEGGINYTRTRGGSTAELTGRVYRNNDDALVETFYSGAIDGSVLSSLGVMKPQRQKCSAFSLELELPSNDVTVRVDGFSAVIGLREGALSEDSGQQWKR